VTKMLAPIALLAALAGCVTTEIAVSERDVAPRTYRPEATTIQRSVGMLRKLVVLPIVLQTSPEDQESCASPCDWPALRRGLAMNAVDYLEDDRGYKVSSMDPHVETASIGLEPEALADAARKLADFARSRRAGAPPAELAALVRDIGVRADVDGVVVLHGSVTVVTWWDWAAIYATFMIATPIVLRANAYLEADIFDVLHGHLVWAGTYDKALAITSPPAPATMIADLFDLIEPALPAVFASPAAPAKQLPEGATKPTKEVVQPTIARPAEEQTRKDTEQKPPPSDDAFPDPHNPITHPWEMGW